MAKDKKAALGKGLGALFGEDAVKSAETNTALTEKDGVTEISVYDIDPNIDQPRKNFDEEKLKILGESIQQHGIFQPIIVKKENDRYKIVAGERRWRAARLVGLKTVPVIIREYSDKRVMEIALLENVQRQDLNPIEEGEAYQKLMEEHSYTQEEVASLVGRSRPAVANMLRILNLSDHIKKYIISEEITEGHARALISIEDDLKKEELIKDIIEKGLSVREIERIVREKNEKKAKYGKKTEKNNFNEEVQAIEEKIKNKLGAKVKFSNSKGKGKIIIEYFSNEELEGILEKIGI